jgi:hypothetical protein
MHTRKLVGWSMRDTLHTQIALEALTMAIERQKPVPGLIYHSDRDVQYAAEAYRAALAKSGITPSMSRKGDCWDNAPMESFFHTLKTERVHHRVYATRAEARRNLFGYIEGFYNSRRLHSALWAISAPPRWNAERLNPVHFLGGRSVKKRLNRSGFPSEHLVVDVLAGLGSIDRGDGADLLSLAVVVRGHEGRPGQRLKTLEVENARLRRAVSDLTLAS